MELALKIMGWWVLLSFTLGPCLTWLFFYGERRSQGKDRRVPIGNAGRRLNPDAVDSQTALEQAKAVARAERDKLGTGNESVSQPG